MGLKHMLNGKWFTRLVMISWIICAVLILVIFKNMELIVHGQLYSYGLVFSSDWADPFRIFTWLLFLCLGLPMALSGVALVSSFFKIAEVPKKENLVPQRQEPPRGVVKVESPSVVKEAPRLVENSNSGVNVSGMSCPNCRRVFGRALVMLDFRGGKNRMVSVCPYCNTVLGYTSQEKTSEEKVANGSFHVATPEEKTIR
jgi:hypothetical protein